MPGLVHVSPIWTMTILHVMLLIPTYVLVHHGLFNYVNYTICIY